MLSNYLRIGLRNLKKHRSFSLINVLGLSLALTVFLFIFLFVQDELTYDRMHGKVDRIYRINTIYTHPGTGEVYRSGSSSPAMAAAFAENFPQVEQMVRIQERAYLMQHREDIFIQEVDYADAALFSTFDFPLYSGTALSGDPTEMLITRSFAERFFNNQDPIGKELMFDFGDGFEPIEIVGIAEDIPDNSSLQFEVLLPFSKYASIESDRMDNFLDLMLSSVLLVKEGTDVAALQDGLEEYFYENVDEAEQEMFNLELENFADMHFSDTDSGNGLAEGRPAQTSMVLSLIGIFILVIAAINYINLSLGMLLPRAGEIGMRKVLGARKHGIIIQFITETAVVTLVALLLAILLSDLLQPQFETLMSKRFPLWEAGWPAFLLTALILFVVITVLAGLYPAVVVARFSTVNSLKRKERLSGHSFISKFLIVLQFTVSMLFVCGAWVVQDQMNFIQQFDLGYEDENVLYLQLPRENNQVLRERLSILVDQHPELLGMTAQTGSGWRTNMQIDEDYIEIDHDKIDENFADLFGLELVSGRFFNKNNPADKNAIVINESLANSLGMEQPVGEMLPFDYFDDMPEARVIGVIKDYHQSSLHSAIRPLVLYTHSDRSLNMVFLKFAEGEMARAVSLVEDFWKREEILLPLSYGYLPDMSEESYATEIQQQKIISFASLFAVMISCLGLFALSGLYITQQQRALGIRKVLGATLFSLWGNVSRRFTILVLIACVIAIPVGWMAASEWLQSFSYRVNLTLWPFISSLLVLLGISLISIFYQAYRAGSVNPVDVLRNE